MKQYHDLLRKILDEGVVRGDRTGTGTIGLFGQQMRFDLSEGFPLMTTKKMFWRGTVIELLWFLRGGTNEHWLRDRGVHFWKEWARPDGGLGPVYGRQLRCLQTYRQVEPAYFDAPDVTVGLPELRVDGLRGNRNARNTYDVGYLGAYDSEDKHLGMLLNVWRQMIRRCYDQSAKSFAGYGGAGVSVSAEWLCFANFQRDAKKLPGWNLKQEYPDGYSLDKDSKLASNQYNRVSCIWASDDVQNVNKSNTKPFSAISPDGERVVFPSIGAMKRVHSVSPSAVHRCLTGRLKSHHGWTHFEWLPNTEGSVWRYSEVDQLRTLIAGLKHDPESRRHVVTLWNPSDLDAMELTTCHGTVIQFFVADGKLSCQMYQRSADMFLGVPVNIASYALLTHIIANEVSLKVGELIITFGDSHIYNNHREQVAEQLSRTPKALPTLVIDPAPREPGDILPRYTENHFSVLGYEPAAAIKAPVAV